MTIFRKFHTNNFLIPASGKAKIALLATVFSFGLPMVARAEAPVNLGTAHNFVILSKTGVTTTGATEIVGNIGVSPIASTAITGFGLIRDKTNRFSRSSLVRGRIYAANYAPTTPNVLTVAVGDMQAAYNNAAGRKNPTRTELGAGNIGGMTIKPGLYKWSSGVLISKNVTLRGSQYSVWIFQVAGTLRLDSGTNIVLAGGAQAKNVFWQVAGETTIETTATFNGTILDKTAIVMKTGATLNGIALAQTAVTLEANTVTFNPVSQ